MTSNVVRRRLSDSAGALKADNLRGGVAEHPQNIRGMLAQCRQVEVFAPRFVRKADWRADLVAAAGIGEHGTAFAEVLVIEHFGKVCTGANGKSWSLKYVIH